MKAELIKWQGTDTPAKPLSDASVRQTQEVAHGGDTAGGPCDESLPTLCTRCFFFGIQTNIKKKLDLELSKSAIKRIYRYFILILKNPPTITKRLKSALITSNYLMATARFFLPYSFAARGNSLGSMKLL